MCIPLLLEAPSIACLTLRISPFFPFPFLLCDGAMPHLIVFSQRILRWRHQLLTGSGSYFQTGIPSSRLPGSLLSKTIADKMAAPWPGKPPHLNRWISTFHPQPKLCLLVQLYIFSLLYYYEYYFMLAALQFTYYIDFMCEVVSTMPCFKPF